MADNITYEKADDFSVKKLVSKTVEDEQTLSLDALTQERAEWERRKAEFSATCDAEIARLTTDIDAAKAHGVQSYAEVTEAARIAEIAEAEAEVTPE